MEAGNLKVTQFNEEAQKLTVTIDKVRHRFEDKLAKGKILGIISPDKSEVICFKQNEIESLTSELSSGKISLTNLSQQLNLTDYHLHLVLTYLLKIGRINGELTYNTFVTKTAMKKLLLQKAKVRKHNHRREMRTKR
jgi:hypothetical protein